MVIKPFSHLARQSFAKTLAHGYAQSVVAASQSSYATTTGSLGQFHHYPIQKFARTSQLQNVFQTASSSSGSGAKAGHASQGGASSSDGGLAAYYAAWQHAQQTGDETDWRQHQFSKKIGWKSRGRTEQIKRGHRHEVSLTPESSKSLRTAADRAFSESDLHQFKSGPETDGEAEALDRVNEAIAREIQSVQESHLAEDHAKPPQAIFQSEAENFPSANTGAGKALQEDQTTTVSPSHITTLTSSAPAIHSASDQIVGLASAGRYADIPAVFESMLKDSIVPTVEGYNAILESAIHLTRSTYQVIPKALEVYGDMVRRGVDPNEHTHIILIDFLTAQAKNADATQASLHQKGVRYGNTEGGFLFKSTELEHELLTEDVSLDFAMQQYQTAKTRFTKIRLPTQLYVALIQACARHCRVPEMITLLSDMKRQNIAAPGSLFVSVIKAFTQTKDLKAANKFYEEYRSHTTAKTSGDTDVVDRQDMQVYAALIQVFLASDNAAGGFRFFSRILHSYENAVEAESLKAAMEETFATAFIDHTIATRDFDKAIDFVQCRDLDSSARNAVLTKLSAAAADAGKLATAGAALQLVNAQDSLYLDAKAAILAAELRQGDIEKARTTWKSLAAGSKSVFGPLELTTMYACALLKAGYIEEALSQARLMFGRARDSMSDLRMRPVATDTIDESVVMFGDILREAAAVVSAPANIHLIRMMLENGGLVSPIAEQAMASLGPECVHHLSSQDITLALHVQAGMLSQVSGISDPAHAPRFSHLLETVLARGIPMDPSTIHAVTECVPRIESVRPDLVQRWQAFLQPVQSKPASISPSYSTSSPVSSGFESPAQQKDFDPYVHSTDFRTSSVIAEKLESPGGRLENHLSEALSRFRNVRRAGRHPRYTTYAKLITAAGKTGQVHLVHEVLGMARHDVPLIAGNDAVRAGWIPILDAMVAACLTIGDRQLAAKYHQELGDMRASPSANTFGLYITTMKETTKTFDEATEAVKIFQRAVADGVEPGVFLYNAVIGKLGKARRIDDCLFYFGDMQSRNVKPTSVTYGTLVNALCRTSEEAFAEEMFDEMESMSNYRPRAAPYNSIIQFFLNTKRDRSKVLAYYSRMKAKHIKPTSHTFKLLIEAHAALEPVDLRAAEAVLGDMKAAGMQPESVHYGTLIHAKGCVMHDMAGARALFNDVISNGTVRPTDNLYQNLFESMVANHQVAETSEVLRSMAKRNVEMTAYIANTLIHGWAAEGSVSQAKLIYDSLGYARREPSTYEAMTRAFLSVEDHPNASAIVQEMLSKGYPSAVTEKVLLLTGSGST